MSSSTSHKLYIVEETEYGITPTNAEFKELPITGTTLGLTKNASQTNTIRSDRQISEFRDGTHQVGGDLNVELQWEVIDPLLSAALCGNWENNTLKAGTQRRSFSILRHFTTLSSAQKPFQLFTGVELNNINIQLGTEGVTTVKFATLGKSVTTLSDLPNTMTLLPQAPLNAFDSFNGTVTEGKEQLGIATEVGFTLENGIEPRFVVGSKETIRPNLGLANATGQLGVYFESQSLLDKFFSGEASSLSFEMKDPTGHCYKVSLPNIRYTGGQPDVEGVASIIVSLPFQAVVDDKTGSNIVIEKVPQGAALA